MLEFELIFEDKAYDSMTLMRLGPASDGYTRFKIWRSTDLGQTYRASVMENHEMGITVFIVTRPASTTVSAEEGKVVLDTFYPNRVATRPEYSSSANSLKYSVWPGEADYLLPWYSSQLVADRNI